MLEAKLADTSMSFDSMVSTSQTSPWFSPQACNLNAPTADLVMWRYCSVVGSFAIVGKAWVGALVDVRHRVALRFELEDGTLDYYIGGFHFKDSCVLLWPCSHTSLDGTSSFYFDITATRGRREPVLKLIYSLSDTKVRAAVYSWRSWAWQKHAGAATSVKPGLRALRQTEWMPLVTIAAKSAFWLLGKCILQDFAKELGVELPRGSTLAGVLYAMVKGVLGHSASDAAILDILHQRLAVLEWNTSDEQVLLSIGEALEVLDPIDHPKVTQEQAHARAIQEEVWQFKSEYLELARQKQGDRKARRKQKPLPKLGVGPSTRDLKPLLPPGASIWRGEGKGGSWNGHYPPYRRVSARWAAVGEEQARTSVLARLWRQHLTKHALSGDHCPFEGLVETLQG